MSGTDEIRSNKNWQLLNQVMGICGFIVQYICIYLFCFVGGSKSYTPRLSLSLPAIYLSQVYCGNYNDITSQ